jgi:hemerythrin-like domain-containing protein
MSYLAELRVDHENAWSLLRLLAEQAQRIRNPQLDADFELMRDIMLYMTRYADVIHHPRERPLFEVCLEQNPNWRSTVMELGAEHQSLFERGAGLSRSISAVLSDAMVDRLSICDDADGYRDLYISHMKKEERLFSKCEDLLEEAHWQRISAAFEASADPVFGPVVAEELENLRSIVQAR